MRIAIVNVATGPYIELWEQLLPQLDQYAFPAHEVGVHILTDDTERAGRSRTSRVQVKAHAIPPYRWPEATLLRYEMIASIAPALAEYNVVMYLDVDMQVVRPFGDELAPDSWIEGIALAQHPGYRRRPGATGALTRLRHPRALASDLRTWIKHRTPPGAWESDPSSTAFVAPPERETYVHGAVWMGRSEPILEMCRLLAQRTSVDKRNSIMATWHDESHLNWFYAVRRPSLLDTSYSCVNGWWQVADVSPRILSVQKSEGFR